MNAEKLNKFATASAGRKSVARFFLMDDGTVVTGTYHDFMQHLKGVMPDCAIKNFFYGRRKSPFASVINNPSAADRVRAVELADYLKS